MDENVVYRAVIVDSEERRKQEIKGQEVEKEKVRKLKSFVSENAHNISRRKQKRQDKNRNRKESAPEEEQDGEGTEVL